MNETGARDGCSLYPDRVSVIGAGRWARVMIETLCGILPVSIEISVHSPGNAMKMSDWVMEQGLNGRVHVFSEWPQYTSTKSSAAIVVNAASDHERTVEAMLSAGIPVLVEKPMASSEFAAQRLVDIAHSRNIPFATAHIFLFAKYLNLFACHVAKAKDIPGVRLVWADPKSENRYGEKKRYDPGLPIFADWLPHVLSILGLIVPDVSQRCDGLEFHRGGAHLKLKLMLGDIPCHVELIRNDEQRQRVIEVTTEGDMLQLDFTNEPGTIMSGSRTIEGDADWGGNKRPLAQMLISFLKWAAGGEFDDRLDAMIGLQACKVIDQAEVLYHASMLSWILKKTTAKNWDDEELQYAFKEILLSQGTLMEKDVDSLIRNLRQRFTGKDGLYWQKQLADSRDPFAQLKTIAINSEVRG